MDITKTSNQLLLEFSESDVFRHLDFWLLKGVFGFGGIWFTLWRSRIDYFNFAIFWTYLATFSLKKNEKYESSDIFSFFVLKRKQSKFMKKEKKIFVEKKYEKFHSNFFTWHWLTIYTFSSINRNPQAPKKSCEYSLAYFYPFWKFTIFRDGQEHFPTVKQNKVNFYIENVLLIKI